MISSNSDLDLVAELAVRQDVRKVLADAAHHGATDLDRIHRPVHRVEHRIGIAFAGHRLGVGILAIGRVEDSSAGQPGAQHRHADALGREAEPQAIR